MKTLTKVMSQRRKCGVLIVCLLLCGCQQSPQFYSASDYALVAKIDAHAHTNNPSAVYAELARTNNFRLVSINVDEPDFPPVSEQLAINAALRARHGAVFAFASAFSMEGWGDPAWLQNTLDHLHLSFSHGAIAVKVYKDIGMRVRDGNGNLVMIDDPGFQPVFEYLIEQEIPVVGHLGEPRNCWLPLDEMTVSGDRHYFAENPQYHMYLHPEFPSYQEQIDARNRVLDNNPELRFMGAHLASLEWSVDELAKFLDAYPNAVVDMAARIGQLQYQSRIDRDKVRDFFLRYQDRLLYATDLDHEVDFETEWFVRHVERVWRQDWAYFTSNEQLHLPEGEVQGLHLPTTVIDKIYATNALNFFTGAFAVQPESH